ncbi:von Willebrand factor A domain-containing protein 5A [Corynascus novoguineensis]|uniref:von Willebrand factor A domain-containing protein 5A n=1 Tax=Corynascus novoguineensis TaxID=1126955 RepID=A0AAN7CLD2_9PEZI|nr:von Willebrand factor A domain-containing protein 5A [Corynascus novoguineensis]
MGSRDHICGLYYVVDSGRRWQPERKYLPQLSLSAKAKIVSTASRTNLTQTFVNPLSEAITKLRYTFPLYSGASVVGFVCTINNERIIRGVVKERSEAKKTFQDAVDRGQTAGLLEQLPEASDVFTTTIGNVPANATLQVELTYLCELKQDAELDGIRFTIPTQIAPRYGHYPGKLLSYPPPSGSAVVKPQDGGISIVVDVEMPDGYNVRNIQSPSHPISVTLGNTSAEAASGGADMSLQKASATLSLSTAQLGNDFVLQVVVANAGNPVAVLETHPTLPNHRALMASLVPRFNLPHSKPEIVFLCDRSGSMEGTKIANLKTALQLFLKSLPVGVKFNICSFGSRHKFLFEQGSQTYDQSSLEVASQHVDTFRADFGGTELYDPIKAAFEKRYADMDLEVFLVTDGQVWDQSQVFDLVNREVAATKGRVRVFSLGIGRSVSHALIEGVAAAGNGYSQAVGDNENMNAKVVRMLKAALTPHVTDYTMEIRYGKGRVDDKDDEDDDFEMVERVEKVMDGLTIQVTTEPDKTEQGDGPPTKPISLFDQSADPDVEMTISDTSSTGNISRLGAGKYSHVPHVPEPKILQAPFAVPPLYPFNRTTVYLLLSPETIQRQPTSVVLSGTSRFGPLELEVPVTVLPDKSEMVHQLAARRAVKELEEGRGWIFHAMDAAGEGTRLQDKYPGRFQDMVEREAVRLGVTYQVGGKWCSFVAIEDDDQEVDDQEQATIRPWVMPAAANLPSSDSFSGSMRASLKGAAPATAMLSRPSPPPPPYAFPLSSVPAPASIPAPAPYAAPYDYSTPTASVHKKARRSCFTAPQDDRFFGRGGPAESEHKPVSEPKDKQRLDALVGLQSFDGSWSWCDRLLRLVGLLPADDNRNTAESVAQRATQVKLLGSDEDKNALATALVLAYLRTSPALAARRDEWEMLADKAAEWLQGRVPGATRTVEEYVEEVKVFLMREAGEGLVR